MAENENPFKPPTSALKDQRTTRLKRSLWWMVIVNLYFWPKLIDYLSNYWASCIDLIYYGDWIGHLTFSINIPIYIAVICYIFHVRLNPRLFWKIWSLVALGDELRAIVLYRRGFFYPIWAGFIGQYSLYICLELFTHTVPKAFGVYPLLNKLV